MTYEEAVRIAEASIRREKHTAGHNDAANATLDEAVSTFERTAPFVAAALAHFKGEGVPYAQLIAMARALAPAPKEGTK